MTAVAAAAVMEGRLDWEHDGTDWPNRAASRFVAATGLDWHVQQLGRGPALLLLHGTGASTHSWRDLAPLLAGHFAVVAPDLPGHAFTDALPRARLSLEGMAEAIAGLLDAIGCRPEVVVGHSAGAAIAAELCLTRRIEPRLFVSLNGALLPLPGVPGLVFKPMARLLAANPFMARLFAWRARDPGAVRRLVSSTGSRLDPSGVELYARLVRSPAHVGNVLEMMAGWDLSGLERRLARLEPHVVLVTGGADLTVPPAESQRVRALLPHAELDTLPGLGHLAHEEEPQAVAEIILRAARRWGILPRGGRARAQD